MPNTLIERNSIIRTLMDAHRETVAVLLRRRMHLPDCFMAPFITLEEAAANYGVDLRELVTDLRAVVLCEPSGARP